jgi:hypothetical protein
MIHSAADRSVLARGADEFFDAFRSMGTNIGYTRYPHAAHGETCSLAYWDRTHYEWLLQQKRRAKTQPLEPLQPTLETAEQTIEPSELEGRLRTSSPSDLQRWHTRVNLSIAPQSHCLMGGFEASDLALV